MATKNPDRGSGEARAELRFSSPRWRIIETAEGMRVDRAENGGWRYMFTEKPGSLLWEILHEERT